MRLAGLLALLLAVPPVAQDPVATAMAVSGSVRSSGRGEVKRFTSLRTDEQVEIPAGASVSLLWRGARITVFGPTSGSVGELLARAKARGRGGATPAVDSSGALASAARLLGDWVSAGADGNVTAGARGELVAAARDLWDSPARPDSTFVWPPSCRVAPRLMRGLPIVGGSDLVDDLMHLDSRGRSHPLARSKTGSRSVPSRQLVSGPVRLVARGQEDSVLATWSPLAADQERSLRRELKSLVLVTKPGEEREMMRAALFALHGCFAQAQMELPTGVSPPAAWAPLGIELTAEWREGTGEWKPIALGTVLRTGDSVRLVGGTGVFAQVLVLSKGAEEAEWKRVSRFEPRSTVSPGGTAAAAVQNAGSFELLLRIDERPTKESVLVIGSPQPLLELLDGGTVTDMSARAVLERSGTWRRGGVWYAHGFGVAAVELLLDEAGADTAPRRYRGEATSAEAASP